jgi:hypothetical protein
MLFQKGITIDETNEDDIYSMLVPGETDRDHNPGTAINSKGNNSNKKDKKPLNIRSPF